MANTKLSKPQLSKIGQSGGFLAPLLRTGLSLMKNVLKSSAINVLIPLGLTATATATDLVLQKKIFESDINPVC